GASCSIASRTASRACRLAWISEMIATRMGPRRVRLATLTVLAGVWAAAAFFLWDSTRVPDGLHIRGLHAGDFFSERLLRKGDHYETFLRVDALLATAATIIVFVFYARVGNRFMR